MYQAGDLVVYGRTGVCRVTGIERGRDGQLFYALEPLYQSCSILTPVEGKVFMRPILTREECDALIDSIPSIQAEPYESKAQRELTEHYQAAIATHDCGELLALTQSLYRKRRAAERAKRKFGAVDERFMREGEALLFGELGAALDIPPEEVPRYIRDRLGRAKVPAGKD